MKIKKKIILISVYLVVASFFLSISYYLGFINYMEPTKIGIAKNLITGKVWLQDGGGVFISPPWVWVTRIDTRPVRVSVPSAGHCYSAKLVQFEKRGWEEFVTIQGWHFYWWANRLSLNLGYKRDEEHRGMKDLLRGYAYGPKSYSFITVLSEYKIAP